MRRDVTSTYFPLGLDESLAHLLRNRRVNVLVEGCVAANPEATQHNTVMM